MGREVVVDGIRQDAETVIEDEQEESYDKDQDTKLNGSADNPTRHGRAPRRLRCVGERVEQQAKERMEVSIPKSGNRYIIAYIACFNVI